MKIIFKFHKYLIPTQIQEEVEKTKSGISAQMFGLPEGSRYITKMPEKGKSADDLLTMMKKEYKGMGKEIIHGILIYHYVCL